MPENETLRYDGRSASRWLPIRERIDGGQNPTELFPLIQDQVYAAGKRVWKHWQKSGFDPAQLFNAAQSGSNEFRDLIKQASFDDYARLLRDVAAEIQDPDMERLIKGFLHAFWQNVQSEIHLNRCEEAPSLEFNGLVEQMLSCIAHSLLNNLSRFPNRPSRNLPPPDLDTQLDEPLL